MVSMDKALLFAVLAGLAASLTASEEMICPDMNVANCYPKKFTPTSEWQLIKPGQEVPEGLHYKMDFESGLKHAKLMDLSEKDDGKTGVAVVQDDVVGSPRAIQVVPEEETPVNVVKEQRIKDSIAGEGAKFHSALELLLSIFQKKLDSSASIETLINSNAELINDSLDTLIYSSHDIKYGEQLTANNNNVVMFFSIINSNIKDYGIREKSLRIISSSIRNNDKSLLNIIENNSNELFKSIVNFIEKESLSQNAHHSQVLIKRAIGILSALVYNDEGLLKFENLNIKDFLSTKFHLFNSDVKERCVNLLNDVEMLINAKSHRNTSDEL